MPRYLSIDILRGVAILLMIQVHFVDHLSSPEESTAWLYQTSALLGMIPAPLFTFVSGMSFCLWTRKQEANGETSNAITKIAVRRGLFLFGAGLVFNFFVWLPEETFNWDILTLLGAALLILAVARHLPAEVLGLICVLVLLLSPPLRGMADYPSYWQYGDYDYDFTFRDVLLGFIVNGYFPLLPWIVFPLIGFAVGDVASRRSNPSNAWLAWLAAIGVGLLSLAAIGVFFKGELPTPIAKYYIQGFTLYPATTEYVLALLGISMLSFAGLHRWIDLRQSNATPGPVMRFLQRWSFFSLTIYIVHHLVHIWPLWLYGVRMGQEDPTFYFHQAMSTPAAFGLAVAFVVACTFALTLLERHKEYSFESILRWVCD